MVTAGFLDAFDILFVTQFFVFFLQIQLLNCVLHLYCVTFILPLTAAV